MSDGMAKYEVHTSTLLSGHSRHHCEQRAAALLRLLLPLEARLEVLYGVLVLYTFGITVDLNVFDLDM